MKEGSLPGAVSPPVKMTARRLASVDRSLHAEVSELRMGVLTMLSLAGLEIVMVATVLSGEYSLLVTETPADESLPREVAKCRIDLGAT